MNVKSNQNQNQKQETLQAQIVYPKCLKEGHGLMDLKFIDRTEINNIQHIYCPLCLEEHFSTSKTKVFDIISLDQIIREINLVSQEYSDRLEPMIGNFHRKHQEISENDFRNMFEELTLRSEDFKKVLDNFQSHIAVLCGNFERLFQKRLEAIFYESLIDIDAKLSSSKKTFEILRLKIRSYSNDVTSFFKADNDLTKYCENINSMIKDLAALKNSSLPQQISNLIYKVPVTSHIVEKFRTSCNFDTEITHLTESIIACLSQKFKSMQHDLNVAIIKLNQGYQASKSKQSDPKKSKSDDIVHDSNCQCHRHHHEDEEYEEEEEPTDPSPPPMDKGSLTEPLLANTQKESFENKTEDTLQTEEVQINQENNKIPEGEKVEPEPPKEDGSEQLRRFAASLMLKAEKRAKGEEKNIRDEDSPKKDRDDLRKELSGIKDYEKQYRNKAVYDSLRVSKKITKPKRSIKQREKDIDQKLGRYIGLDGQKKLLKKEKISLIKENWGGEIKTVQDLQDEDDEDIEAEEEEELATEAKATSFRKSL